MNNRQRILEILAAQGPCTGIRMAHRLGCDRGVVGKTMSRMSHSSPRCPQVIHVSGWAYHDLTSKKNHPRAVYSLGAGVNVPRPPNRRDDLRRASQARCRKRANLWRISSPFNMGVSAHAARYSENRK